MIIGVVVVVLLFIGYGVFMTDGNSEDPSNALTRQNSTAASASSEPGNTAAREFVTQLLAIQNIHFKSDIFSDPAYLYLRDFGKEITKQDVGRSNPFLPIGQESGTPPTSVRSTGSFVNTSSATSTKPATSTPTTGGTVKK